MSSDIQVGDKVRLVLEETVTDVDDEDDEGRVYFDLEVEDGADWEVGYLASDDEVVSIEVIEKKVTTFKPGDVVRSKALGFKYAIGKDGYLCHAGGHRRYADIGTFRAAEHFTSEHYELVTLHEPPL